MFENLGDAVSLNIQSKRHAEMKRTGQRIALRDAIVNKIKRKVEEGETHCRVDYDIFIPEDILLDAVSELKSKGFVVTFIGDDTLSISWGKDK